MGVAGWGVCAETSAADVWNNCSIEKSCWLNGQRFVVQSREAKDWYPEVLQEEWENYWYHMEGMKIVKPGLTKTPGRKAK